MRHLSSIARPVTALALAAATGVGALALGTAAGGAQAAPPLRNYVKTIRCDSANPFPAPRVPISVDVWNQVRFPSDGLPGPAIELIASSPRPRGLLPNTGIYTMSTTVNWHNVTTGKRGVVRVPTRAERITWQAVLHPGAGQVNFRITQRIGAMVFVPMVNPQVSTCRGSARA